VSHVIVVSADSHAAHRLDAAGAVGGARLQVLVDGDHKVRTVQLGRLGRKAAHEIVDGHAHFDVAQVARRQRERASRRAHAHPYHAVAGYAHGQLPRPTRLSPCKRDHEPLRVIERAPSRTVGFVTVLGLLLLLILLILLILFLPFMILLLLLLLLSGLLLSGLLFTIVAFVSIKCSALVIARVRLTAPLRWLPVDSIAGSRRCAIVVVVWIARFQDDAFLHRWVSVPPFALTVRRGRLLTVGAWEGDAIADDDIRWMVRRMRLAWLACARLPRDGGALLRSNLCARMAARLSWRFASCLLGMRVWPLLLCSVIKRTKS